jgi:hypothetical protein
MLRLAVALATLGVLRALGGPLLVPVDDAQVEGRISPLDGLTGHFPTYAVALVAARRRRRRRPRTAHRRPRRQTGAAS